MPKPTDALVFVHNAIRKEVRDIEAAVGGLDTADALQFPVLAERFALLTQFLHDHEGAEEQAFFPAIEERAPHVIEAYEIDHRSNDEIVGQMARSLDQLQRASGPTEAAVTARALQVHAIELRATLMLHLRKEERHLVGVTDKYYTLPEQGAIVGRMSAAMPREHFVSGMGWVFGRLEQDDRTGLLSIMRMGAPPEVFGAILGIVQRTVTPEDWMDLGQRIPGLAETGAAPA